MWAYIVLSFVALSSAQTVPNGVENSRVIIVGAGSAGIAAASKLFQSGMQNVLILEAEDRIGGRVNTVEFDGHKIDMGAQWVHGQVGNVAYELVEPLGLTDDSTHDNMVTWTYDSSGDLIDPEIDAPLFQYYINITDRSDKISSDNYTSIGDYYEKEFARYFAEHPEISESRQKQYLWFYNLLRLGYDAADDWHDVSVQDYKEYVATPGNQAVVWKDGGYGTILDILMKKIPDPEQELPVRNHTILNTEVTKIDYSTDDGTVKVTTADGSEYIADHVIVTVSLGVLKAEHETLFNPRLPEDKIVCIENLGFGSVTKTFLSFEEPWWTNATEFQGFFFLWTDSDRDAVLNDPQTQWLYGHIGYFPVAYRPRLLAGWVTGTGAKLMETMSDEQVMNQTTQMLRNFLHKDYSIPDPIKMTRSKWFTNKHFRGTYSHRTVHTEKTNASAEGLSQPIIKSGKPVILFAGEATNKIHFSTVHGAIETGWREAQRILDYYGSK